MHFVVIIIVAISYVLKKEQERCKGVTGCVKIPKRVTNLKRLKHCIRRYGPPLNANLSKCPPSQINCPPLV